MRSKFKWIFTLLVAMTMQFSFAQEKTITGVVQDAQGDAIAGANVTVQGSSRKTQSDFDGKYSIKASTGDVLVYSFVGMQEIRRTVGAANTITVKLPTVAKELNEVVIQSGVVGIKKTKDGVTYAEKTISNKELTTAVNPSAIFALQGKVSGVQISNTSVGVNSESRILIRGIRTISGNNDALVVIDNAISTAQIFGQLPPESIESVTVIKGAQGAAIYGAQGVNGAVIVTTKKGSKTSKVTVAVNSSVDFENVSYVPNRQSEYGQGWAADPGFQGPGLPLGSSPNSGFVPWENGNWGPAFVGAGMPATVPVGLPQADGKFLTTSYTYKKDNIKNFFQTGTIFQNGVAVSMGGPESYVNFTYNRQNSSFMVAGDELVRNTFLLKAGKKFGKLNVEGNINYISQNTTQTDPDLYDDLMQTGNSIPIELFRYALHQNHWTVYAKNPWQRSKTERYDDRINTVNAILNSSYEFNKNISVNFLANANMRFTDGQSHVDGFNNLNPALTYDVSPYQYLGDSVLTYSGLGGTAITSSYYANQSARTNIYSDLVFNFNYDLTSDLNLKFNVGANVQDRLSRITTQGGTNLDRVGFYNIINVKNPDNPTSLGGGNGLGNRVTQTRQAAGFVNADLNYGNYLFLNATARQEQSSVVTKSYFYPSVGVSFVPTKAFDVFKDNKILNYMKFNASYTSVGNTSAIGAYATNELARVPLGFPYGNLGAYQYDFQPTNPSIKPEFVNTMEVGATLGFFNDRITLQGSYYDSKTIDLITFVNTSSFSGASNYQDNIGDLSNKGFEIDLGLTPIKTESFRWDLRTNYSAVKTKIVKLAPGIDQVALQSNAAVGVFAQVGEEFPLIKGTTFVRNANGDILVDANGVPQRSSALTKLGKATPDYIVGMTNSFEFKGFRLSATADLRVGASAYSFAKNIMLFTGGDVETSGFDRSLGYIVKGVNPAGGVNTVPYLNQASRVGVLNYFTTYHRQVGESNVIDMSALTIRELSLSYALPKKMLDNTGIQSFRVGINARNPFIWLADGSLLKPKYGLANNGYTNPEASNTAQGLGPNAGPAGNGNGQGIIEIGQYPTSKTYGVSINLTF